MDIIFHVYKNYRLDYKSMFNINSTALVLLHGETPTL